LKTFCFVRKRHNARQQTRRRRCKTFSWCGVQRVSAARVDHTLSTQRPRRPYDHGPTIDVTSLCSLAEIHAKCWINVQGAGLPRCTSSTAQYVTSAIRWCYESSIHSRKVNTNLSKRISNAVAFFYRKVCGTTERPQPKMYTKTSLKNHFSLQNSDILQARLQALDFLSRIISCDAVTTVPFISTRYMRLIRSFCSTVSTCCLSLLALSLQADLP